jgi:DnaJ-class molecular chaperone
LSWDPYAALGVPRAASGDDIRRAYRKLAKELHPDVRPNDRAAEERFKRATAAFNLLTDPKLKTRYDRGEIDADGNDRPPVYSYRPGPGRTRSAYNNGAAESAFDIGDIFSDLFGAPGAGRQTYGRTRGRDITLPVEIDFLDALRGKRQSVKTSDGRTLDVTIPPGVTDAQKLRLKGQGGPGIQGGQPGDALIELRIRPHPYFRRDGENIHFNLQISIVEALEGAKVAVPTASGPVTLTIPENSNSGATLRLKGRGVTEKGDQLVHLQVMLPDSPDEEFRRFVKKWAKRDYKPARPQG